jgi:hypothetical protein
MSLNDVLQDIDRYPPPPGVDPVIFNELRKGLKERLTSQGRGKYVSAASTRQEDKIAQPNLHAEWTDGGNTATITWTELLWGDYNNSGEVEITDIEPLALYSGERTDSGPQDGHRLCVGDELGVADDPKDTRFEINVLDEGPMALNYNANLQGYRVYRGRQVPGTGYVFESNYLPNNDDPQNSAWSVDRPGSVPESARPSYSYTDDYRTNGISSKSRVVYKVRPYGGGTMGVDGAGYQLIPLVKVSGTITYNNSGFSGVTVSLAPDGLSTTTANDGTYEFDNVPENQHTISPNMNGYLFTPNYLTVNTDYSDVTGQDFTAQPGGHSISGTVRDPNSAPVPGVEVDLSNGKSSTTLGNGTYLISGLADGTYTVTPKLKYYKFQPPNQNVVVSGADVTGQDFTGTRSTYSVSGTVTFSFTGGDVVVALIDSAHEPDLRRMLVG